MSFAERNGLMPIRDIQINNIDQPLRNRIYNEMHGFSEQSEFPSEDAAYIVDRLGEKVNYYSSKNWEIIDLALLQKNEEQWYLPYEIIELFWQAREKECNSCNGNCIFCKNNGWKERLLFDMNEILEQERSGYRLIDGVLVKIIHEEELIEIGHVLHSPYESVSIHIKKALSLYSNKSNPDYENSIKESICAVEAICSTISGEKGSQATLGKTLEKLTNSGIEIHSAMQEGFKKLYGYTSDASGIRHGGINFCTASEEDARYMLVSCSAFINYLIAKSKKRNNE